MIRILVESSPGELRVAVLDGETLQDFALWRPGQPDGIGDIYRARVVVHVPAMAGAFIALPEGDGFLPDSAGASGVTEGALITVRVVRASQGGKGPRLAATASRATSDQTESFDRIKLLYSNVVEHYSRADRLGKCSSQGEPGLVSRGPTPLDDLLARYPGITPLPTTFDPALADEIAGLSERDVDLPAGMRASIHPTPALVAIDLDMAAATTARQPKASAQMAANLAALPALARQIRLRNLSGAILVDPAGIPAKRRPKLAPALAAALATDPLQPRLLGFTVLGLAEIVRRRVRPPLHELIAGPHAAGLAALRIIDRDTAAAPYLSLGLTCAPDIAAALSRDPVALTDLARRTGRPLMPRSDPALPPCTWRLERPN